MKTKYNNYYGVTEVTARFSEERKVTPEKRIELQSNPNYLEVSSEKEYIGILHEGGKDIKIIF